MDKKKTTRLFSLLLLAAALGTIVYFVSNTRLVTKQKAAMGEANLFLLPASGEHQENQQFSLQLNIDNQGRKLIGGYKIYISFNPDKIELTNFVKGPNFPDGDPNGVPAGSSSGNIILEAWNEQGQLSNTALIDRCLINWTHILRL